ncbi:MAG: hypothetical protein GXP40_07005 [Chloroflexi bacterium]|nr:hypothetical protein [Chloroflexota bacterium]
MKSKTASKPLSTRWPLFFLMAFLEGGIALTALILIPPDPKNSVFLGFSTTRLVLISGLTAVMAASVFFGLLSWRSDDWRERWLDPARSAKFYTGLTVISAVAALAAGAGLFLLRYFDPERLMQVFLRSRPLLLYVLVLGLQLTIWLLLLRHGFHWRTFLKRKHVYRAAGIALAVLLLVMVVVKRTRLGLIPDPAYWAEPGVALQGWQVALAVLGGLFILVLGLRVHFDRDAKAGTLTDALLALALWGVAVGSWLSVPLDVLKNSFYSPIAYPLGQPLPYSDAGFYDYLSQGLLLGNGFMVRVPPRPLYVVFLAGLHALFGVRYDRIIMGQTIVLALFPVVLYFLGKKLHSRAAGVTIGLLAIFRELTGLWISSAARVSNSKMMLTDVPTALVLSLGALLVLRWLQSARKDARQGLLPLVAGGVFGLLLLLRTQSMLILPFIFFIALLAFWPRWRQWVVAALVFVLGVTVSVGPWLLHNWHVTGKVTFDDPQQLALLSSQYSFSENLNLDAFDFESESLANNLLGFVIQNPGYAAGFIANHFMATEIDGLLALPLFERFDGLQAPVNLYWTTWDGRLAGYNIVLIVFYLALIAVGLGAAWHHLRWIGFIPLAFNLGYALANGVARFSGWRYDLPVDWVAYFYFGIGVVELLGGAALLFGADLGRLFTISVRQSEDAGYAPSKIPWAKAGLVAAGFLVIGFLPWMMETAIPPHFESLPEDALIARAASLPSMQDAGNTLPGLQAFAEQPDAVILAGRLLYPRFYRRGDGIFSAHPWAAYAQRDFPRMGFIVIDQTVTQAVLPMGETPAAFPNGADVIVLGCQHGDYLEVRTVSFVDADITYLGEPLSAGCLK